MQIKFITTRGSHRYVNKDKCWDIFEYQFYLLNIFLFYYIITFDITIWLSFMQVHFNVFYENFWNYLIFLLFDQLIKFTF